MLELEKKVPPVYVDDSRDFQVLLRAYSSELSATKNLIDSTKYVTDTNRIKSKLLPLLKTKLGFFTDYAIDDDMLRGILAGFPSMVKKKGSLEAIQEAINIFLRVLNIKTQIILTHVGADTSEAPQGIEVTDHTILIGLSSALKNYHVLEELFKYIMPAGYSYAFYFYRTISALTPMISNNHGNVIIISNYANNSIRSAYNNTNIDYTDDINNRMLNAISYANVYSALLDVDDEDIQKVYEKDEV